MYMQNDGIQEKDKLIMTIVFKSTSLSTSVFILTYFHSLEIYLIVCEKNILNLFLNMST